METISIENCSLYQIQAWYGKGQKDKEYYSEKDPDYANVITDFEGYVIDVDNGSEFNQYNEAACNDPKEFIWYRFANSDLVESEKIVIIFAVAQDCEEQVMRIWKKVLPNVMKICMKVGNLHILLLMEI